MAWICEASSCITNPCTEQQIIKDDGLCLIQSTRLYMMEQILWAVSQKGNERDDTSQCELGEGRNAHPRWQQLLASAKELFSYAKRA